MIAEVAKCLEWTEEKTAGIIDVIRDVIGAELKMNNPVAIDEFGTLKAEVYPEYILVIPETKERFLMPPSVEVVFNSLFRVDYANPLLIADFTVDDLLYNELNSSFSQFEPTLLNEGVQFPGVTEIITETEYSTHPEDDLVDDPESELKDDLKDDPESELVDDLKDDLEDDLENDQTEEKPDLLEFVLEDEYEENADSRINSVLEEVEVPIELDENNESVQQSTLLDEVEKTEVTEIVEEVELAGQSEPVEEAGHDIHDIQEDSLEELYTEGHEDSLDEPISSQKVLDDEKESIENNESNNEIESMEQEDLVNDQTEIEAVVSSDAIPPEQTTPNGKEQSPPPTQSGRRLRNDKKSSPIWIPIAGGIAIILASLFFLQGVRKGKTSGGR